LVFKAIWGLIQVGTTTPLTPPQLDGAKIALAFDGEIWVKAVFR